MTRDEFLIRREKLKAPPRDDNVIFKGIQFVALGALLGAVALSALIGIMQGR